MNRVAPFDMQIAVWGYDLAGETDAGAMVAERPEWDTTPNGEPLWDRKIDYFTNIRLWHGDEQQIPPWWWALPWVVNAVAELHIMTGV